MHELFLTTHIGNDDLQRALRILQGYCGMSPVNILRRRLTWEGPRTRTPKGIDPAFITRQPPPKVGQWRGLSEQLARQSYVLTLIYDVDREQFGQTLTESDVGSGASQVFDGDQIPGVLRWNDLPDPASTRPVNSRLIVSIENEKGLCTVLKSMNHRFSKEVIQECNRFVHGNVVFELNRYLELPTNGTASSFRNELPPFESLIPFDADNKWILTASVLVLDGNNPEQMQKGIDELVAVKIDFEGCFDFQALDRHIFDTRIKF
ncbi:hypothetical protein EG329_012312 [Mollisiaceae sp. DMI_Dod_QoI]|nr:hypothetical protein EG329_012312 [Helotiales sp. DMI_Dod_QoI]